VNISSPFIGLADLKAPSHLSAPAMSDPQMLGVNRPSVSVFANSLQEKNLIAYSRGNIRIIDEAGLKEHACGCYEALLQIRRQIFEEP
jgi:hypothetical protein